MNHVVARRLIPWALLATLVVASSAVHAQTVTGPAFVTRVLDGDTLYAEIGGRIELVRYLGINTPRIEHPLYGPERYAMLAREANRQLVEGQWVRLVFEGPPRDQLGRLQAYVWAGNRFVNALLVHHGYGEAATASTAGYASYFRMLQEGAQHAGRGLWADQNARIYHRPRPTELAADAGDDGHSLSASGGRVFSAPAPFIPSAPSATAARPLGVPAGPAAPTPGAGSPSYMVPRGSLRR